MLKRSILSAASMLSMIAAPASAKPIYIEIKGTLYDGYDQLDLFGAGTDANLTGYAATLLYEYDSDYFHDPANYYYEGSNAAFSLLGYYSGSAAPGKATITVNNVTVDLTASAMNPALGIGELNRLDYYRYNDYYEDSDLDEIWAASQDSEYPYVGSHYEFYNVSSHGYVYSFGGEITPSVNLMVPVANPIDPASDDPVSYAYFQFDKTVGVDQRYSETFGHLQLSSFIVGSLPAVPEPASWAMMIVGFGSVGATLRRQRRNRARYQPRLAFV